MESLSEDLILLDVKKENLRKAFEAVQSHSPSLLTFNLTWSDLDSHFSSQISSLQSNLVLLQCQQKPQFQPPKSPVTGPAFPEMKSLFQKMDGLGLKTYIMKRYSVRTAIRAEVQDALRCASDPAGLVLVAVEGFHEPSPTGNKLAERALRWSRVMLLEELAALRPEIGAEAKEKAKKLSEEWKNKTTVSVENSWACAGFLYLVAAYGLADDFDMPVLIDFAIAVATANDSKLEEDSKLEQGFKLCRVLSLNVPDLISKLAMMSQIRIAIEFIYEFDLTDTCPPVPILKKHVELSKKLFESERAKKKKKVGLKKFTIYSMRSVIKIIEDYELGSEYPKEEVLEQIEFVENYAAMQQHSPQTPTTSKPPEQENTQDPSGSKHIKSEENPGDEMVNSESVVPEEPSGSKRLRCDQPGDTMVASKRVTDESNQQSKPKPQQQSKPHELSGGSNAEQVGPKETVAVMSSNYSPAGPWPAHSASYVDSTAGPYNWGGTASSHVDSTAGPYNWGGPYPNIGPSNTSIYGGSSIGHFGISGNARPSGPPHVYHPEPPPPVGYFPVPRNGYGLPPQYHR